MRSIERDPPIDVPRALGYLGRIAEQGSDVYAARETSPGPKKMLALDGGGLR